MHRFLNLVRRFGRNERGAFAVVFGLMAVVLIALGGATVDYVSLEQARSRAQIALDAATLALQPDIFKVPLNEADIRSKAEALLKDRVGGAFGVTAKMLSSKVDLTTGSLYLRAEVKMPTIFVNLVGVSTLGAQIQSEARRQKLELEVVMVLDNSGSMLQESRIQRLKEAATCATNTLFYDAVNDNTECTPATGSKLLDNVKMGVVPFTMYVNVGSGNANQSWIDGAGNSPIANDNFDNDGDENTAFVSPVNRLALFGEITNDAWRGCVEARPHNATGGSTEYLDTDDTTPTSANSNTLFVPLFAPDTPSGAGNTYTNYTDDYPRSCDRPSDLTTSCTYTEIKKTCSSYSSCSGVAENKYAFTGPQYFSANARNYIGAYPDSCDCRDNAWATDTGTNIYTGSGSKRTYTRIRTCLTTYIPTGLSNREVQERMCKYQGAIGGTTGQKGPNADCPYGSITPLTPTPSTVKTAISAMVADGGTNIHEGTAWGFRVLSPTAPFTEGNAYKEATAKVMIIMTDGENTAYTASGSMNGSSYFSAYGYPYNSGNTIANSSSNGNVLRLGNINTSESGVETEMDTRTLQTCTNAKAQGITVYTIGLSTDKATSPTTVQNMLTQCASSAQNAFFPNQSSELREVFKKIAVQLTALRLTQ